MDVIVSLIACVVNFNVHVKETLYTYKHIFSDTIYVDSFLNLLIIVLKC